MTIPLAVSAASYLLRASAFSKNALLRHQRQRRHRLFASTLAVSTGVSRLTTLQTLLQHHGVPGSSGCTKGEGDMVPLLVANSAEGDAPELLESLEPRGSGGLYTNLHPYLVPLARSQSTGNIICAYRPLALGGESTSTSPWPIVETKLGAPGMQLLALNSEHLMRRIVCALDADSESDNDTYIDLYNTDLGQGLLHDDLDTPYERGSVETLGYGVDKYVLLRVGPFPDIYASLSQGHLARGDEQSALIAAEAANTKLSGFGSQYRLYSRLLDTLGTSRTEEARDAARMCLRLPLATIGMDVADFEEVARLGQMVDPEVSNTADVALAKISDMCTLMRQVEEKDPQKAEKSPEQVVAEEADQMISDTILQQEDWGSVRPKLGQLFRSAGHDELAAFVELDQ